MIDYIMITRAQIIRLISQHSPKCGVSFKFLINLDIMYMLLRRLFFQGSPSSACLYVEIKFDPTYVTTLWQASLHARKVCEYASSSFVVTYLLIPPPKHISTPSRCL